MTLISCLSMLVFSMGGASAQVQKNPTLNGPIKLTPIQNNNWMRLVGSITLPPPGTGLLANGTVMVGNFPDGQFSKSVFSTPAKNVEFVVGAEGYSSPPSVFAVQYASEPSSMSLTAPYVGWAKPKGLLTTQDVNPAFASKPKSNNDTLVRNAPYVYGADLGFVKLTDSVRYGYFNLSLPPAGYATGTSFYVRVVPVKVSGGQRTPVGPASNWVRVYVSVSEGDHQKKIADTKAQYAKQNAEAQGMALVTEANEARKELWKAYEIRLLSYIPPKFADDSNAFDYFIADRGVSISYSKGTKATNLGVGETYSLNQVKNMLNSNKTWSQDLWDVLNATLNMASNGYKSAKAFAVDTLADGIDAIPGVTVTPSMRAGMAMVLDMALAYCGIPPNLPNIDELYTKGADYLAMTIADMVIEEAVGVSIEDIGANPTATKALAEKAREPAKKALAGFMEKITKPAPFAPDIPETWGSPAPFFRRRPAMMYLEIRRRAGAPLPIGQSWQSLEITFNNTFASIPQVLLPRTIEGRVRIPIALAPLQGPEAWRIVGMMPERNVDPASGVGQPYYGDRGNTNIVLNTVHKLGKSGAMFKTLWPGFSISSGYVNGRPLPDKAIMLAGQMEAALEQPVQLGPANYYGKTKLRWFQP